MTAPLVSIMSRSWRRDMFPKRAHDIFGGAVPLYWVRLVNGIDRPKRIYSANDPDHALLQWSGHPSLEEASQRLGLTVDEYRAMFIVDSAVGLPCHLRAICDR